MFDSSVTAVHFDKLKNRIEAVSAPGKPEDYCIEAVHRDQGSEFEGAMKQYMADSNLINIRTEKDRHSANALVETRNKSLAITASAMLYTAVGTVEDYITQLSGESLRWACQLINNSPITHHQRENGLTAYQEQTGRPSPLETSTVYT